MASMNEVQDAQHYSRRFSTLTRPMSEFFARRERPRREARGMTKELAREKYFAILAEAFARKDPALSSDSGALVDAADFLCINPENVQMHIACLEVLEAIGVIRVEGGKIIVPRS